MNKIYGIIAIFAFSGLLLPTTAIQIDAASDLDSVTKFSASSVFSVTDSVSDNAYTHLEGFKKHIHKMIFHITIFLCRLRFLKMLPSAILNSD